MKSIKDGLERIMEWLSHVNLAIAAVITLAMAMIGTIDILTTNIIGKAVPGALELSQICLALLVFLGIAAASRHHEYIGVDILVNRLPMKGQMLCKAFGWLATTVFFSFWAVQMYHLAAKSIYIAERSEGVFPFPVYPAKTIAFLALVVATIETVRRTLIHLRAVVRGGFYLNTTEGQ